MTVIFILITWPLLLWVWTQAGDLSAVCAGMVQAGTIPRLSSSQWSLLFQALHTTTALQPVEPPHLQRLLPMTATDPGAQSPNTYKNILPGTTALSHLATTMQVTLQGKEKVSSRNKLIEILLFRLGELNIVVFLILEVLSGSQTKWRNRRTWFSWHFMWS